MLSLIRLFGVVCGINVLMTGVGLVNAAAVPTVGDVQRTSVVSEAQRVVNSIAISDRGYFATFHLTLEAAAQGRHDVEVIPGHERIPDGKYAEFQRIDVPPNFARNLLSWAEREMARLPNEGSLIRTLMEPRTNMLICFPTGCVDPTDIGTNCCPF